MKLLTIAIPTYNGAKHLLNNFDKSHIDSDDVEYLIVDDGSKDNTLEVAKQFEKKYKNVRVYHQEPNSYTGGSYMGIFKNLRTKYFYILDCDDYIDLKSLTQDIEIMKKLDNENIDVYLNHFVYENQSNGKQSGDNIEKHVEPNKILTIKNIKKFNITSFFMNHNLIVRTGLIKEHNLVLPPYYYADNQFVAYIVIFAKKYYFIDNVLCHYQIGTNDQSVSNLSMARKYLHHLGTFESTCKMISKETYKSMETRHQRQMLLHYVFNILFLALFSTYMFYKEERDDNFKNYLKKIKKENPYICKKIIRHTPYIFTYLIPKHYMGRFFVYGKRKFAKDIPWDF